MTAPMCAMTSSAMATPMPIGANSVADSPVTVVKSVHHPAGLVVLIFSMTMVIKSGLQIADSAIE